jgi:hypothetical protein
MLSNSMIVKQLRTTADESTTYQNKWLPADNCIELMKAHHTDPTLNSKVLSATLSRNPSTKHVVDLKNRASNQTGIYRNKKQENNRLICYYYYSTVPGSDVDKMLWVNGPFIAISYASKNILDDKTLFKAASRIIKLGEREGCVTCSKSARKRRKKDLASSPIEHQRKQSTQGQRNLQQRRHQQLLPLQTRGR